MKKSSTERPEKSMREFYEPVLNLADPEHHSTMGAFLTLKDPVDGEILRSAVEAVRTRFPYFCVRASIRGKDAVPVPNDLPMTVRNTWDPISFNTEAANFHLAAWKYKGRRLAFEISHSLADGTGILPYVQSVLCLYLSKATGSFFDPAGFRLPGQPIPESETGNPFRDLDVDHAAPLYQKKPIPDFFRLACGADRGKTVFCLKLRESQVMQYCREFDGTPNVIVSVLLAKAARRFDPSCEKAVTAMVCIDHKALLGNHDNYRCFVGSAFLDFPRDRDLDNVQKACTIARGQLMLQAQPENSLWAIRQMKQGLPPPSPDIPQASICVSYPGGRSFGPLAPWIDEFYIMTSLSKITDVLCEITCVGRSFFLAFMQPFSSPDYFRCFLEELASAGIQYDLLRSEPLRLCNIR
ncbi:MAG: hypothetical protein IKQ45_04725 [Clostridia bacterium]|nr:hypothetical protein [Clostridia bacterium]